MHKIIIGFTKKEYLEDAVGNMSIPQCLFLSIDAFHNV